MSGEPGSGPIGGARAMMMVTHVGRPEAVVVARSLLAAFGDAGVRVWVPDDEAEIVAGDRHVDVFDRSCELPEAELVVVVGGDGTILRAAELALGADVPLLGVNLGHVGFLAEVEPENAADLAAAAIQRHWHEEERTILDVVIRQDGEEIWRTWALNEVSVEKAARERMLEVLLEVDHRPLSTWGCDGVICSTPTGSTAYAWSAGGPVVWPDVSAMIVVPLSAHALFSRPLVVSPESVVTIGLGNSRVSAVVWCDGQRMSDAPVGSTIEVTTSPQRLRFARIQSAPFTERLVRKFNLPVAGWRDRGR